MLATPQSPTSLDSSHSIGERGLSWDGAVVDMDCDDNRDKIAKHNAAGYRKVAALSSCFGMVPSLSSSSIASSTTSSGTAELEPELSRSPGSIASFDLRTPLKLTQAVNQKLEDPTNIKAAFDKFSMMYSHAAPVDDKLKQQHTVTKPAGLENALGFSTPVKPAAADDQNISPTRTLASSPVPMGERSSPFAKNNLNRPKLSLPALSPSVFSRPNVPQTPGGSAFYGARDGAATGAPVSPFMPPTPLVASTMQDANAGFFGSAMQEEPCQSPTLSRQSLPAVVSTPRQKLARAVPLQRHGSIGMSPLSQEFASVSMRGKSKSTDSNDVTGLARKLQLSSTEAGSPTGPSSSNLLTPPYSPLTLGKSLPEDSSLLGQRRSSSNSSSSGAASSSKERAKDTIIGPGAEMARSFSASRIKTTCKAAPKPFNLTRSPLDRATTGSAPVMKISFSEQTTPTPESSTNLLNSTPLAESVSLPIPSPSLLSPHAVNNLPLKAPSMDWSFSAPVPPQTVSARHLANHTLHPSFAANYTIRDELGSGGFGFVVSATRKADGMPVAVKFIFKEKVPAHGWVRDPKLGVIPMEAFVLKVVDHLGVVKFIDLFDDRQFFYLVMELHGTPWRQPNSPLEPKPHPGLAAMQRRTSCDLFECIEQHSRLSEEQARWVFAQVVETVWHLDRVGICHRDIKDENCVVDADFNVKLIDFGSAVITDVRKPAPYFNRFFGTMTFASSEILQGKPYRAPQAEVWSLGVLLSILLSGECPFADPSAAIKGRISKPKGAWSQDALSLLFMCLQVDPDSRASISQIREHPWVRKAWQDRKKL